MFIRELELEVDNETKTLQVDQQYEGDTGVVVWDAAIVLTKYLETISEKLKGSKIVELGAGTGAVGLSAAVLGAASVILTDQEELVEFLNHNIDLNKDILGQENDVVAMPLKWGDNDQIKSALKRIEAVKYILVSDCVFYQESVEDLVETLYVLADDATEVILTYEERDSQIKLDVMKLFFEKMKSHFSWLKIPHAEHHPDYQSPDIQIFIFKLLN